MSPEKWKNRREAGARALPPACVVAAFAVFVAVSHFYNLIGFMNVWMFAFAGAIFCAFCFGLFYLLKGLLKRDITITVTGVAVEALLFIVLTQLPSPAADEGLKYRLKRGGARLEALCERELKKCAGAGTGASPAILNEKDWRIVTGPGGFSNHTKAFCTDDGKVLGLQLDRTPDGDTGIVYNPDGENLGKTFCMKGGKCPHSFRHLTGPWYGYNHIYD